MTWAHKNPCASVSLSGQADNDRSVRYDQQKFRVDNAHKILSKGYVQCVVFVIILCTSCQTRKCQGISTTPSLRVRGLSGSFSDCEVLLEPAGKWYTGLLWERPGYICAAGLLAGQLPDGTGSASHGSSCHSWQAVNNFGTVPSLCLPTALPPTGCGRACRAVPQRAFVCIPSSRCSPGQGGCIYLVAPLRYF